MMAGRATSYLSWRRMKWLLVWSLLLFIIGTYVADWWSLTLEKTVIDGQTKYKVKARIYLEDNEQLERVNDPPGHHIPNILDSFRKVVETKEVPFEIRAHNSTSGSKTTVGLDLTLIEKNKRATSTVSEENVKKQTTAKPLPPAPPTHQVVHLKNVSPEVDNNKRVISSITAGDVPSVFVEGANCAALFRNDKTEMMRASKYQAKHPKVMTPDKEIHSLAKNCDVFLKERKYIMSPLNREEADFAIAFSLVIFKDMDMVERLLRAIYRPQNYYCIHVDSKASADFRIAMKAIASCFDNVFVTARSVDVQWAWFSVLEPEIICMEDLWEKYPSKFKYFINLTGQEFPLKTNWELVKILKAYNGANDMESTIERRNQPRTEFVHNGFYATNKKKAPCPVNVTLSKGSVHIAVQSGFVDFVLHDPSGQAFLEWVKDTGVPDETFFSSLNVSPQLGVPGASTGDKETNKDTNPFLTRFKNWGTWPFDFPCAGQRVRMVCIFSIGDLPLLASRPEMFANKFYPDYHPLAYDCIEQRHFNKTRNELLGNAFFHDEYYKQLEFVKHHII